MTSPQEIDDPYFFEIGAIEISIDDDGWLNKPEINESVARAINALQKHDLDSNDGIGILLSNDTHIQQLNKDFREKDKPTNVLSFPQDDPDYLGDIAISLQTIETEAKDQGKIFYHHFIHMLIHGVLHLLGYDHEENDEAEIMESLEVKILQDMGIQNPYIED